MRQGRISLIRTFERIRITDICRTVCWMSLAPEEDGLTPVIAALMGCIGADMPHAIISIILV